MDNSSMNFDNFKEKYNLKELELQSLLEITQAINNNLPEESIYKIYNFTIRGNFNIRKLALYVMDEEWNCKTYFGTERNFREIPIEMRFMNVSSISPVQHQEQSAFNEFEIVIPVAHKDQKLAFVFVSGKKDDTVSELVNTNFVQAISNIIIVAIENKKLVRRQLEQEMLRKELEIASNLQQYLFPKELPNVGGLRMSAFYQPHHSIGGDYYDYIRINNEQFLFCIADVSGKGIPAAMLMSNFQASLHTLIRSSTLLQDIIKELNFLIQKNAQGQHFITFFVGIYDQHRRRLKYVNAGHNPPILIDQEGKMQLLEKGTTVLGAFEKLPFLDVEVIEDLSEFFFCTYTDGLIEITNDKAEEFGMQRLQNIVSEYYKGDLDAMHHIVIDQMKSFKGPGRITDDITLFSGKVNSNSN